MKIELTEQEIEFLKLSMDSALQRVTYGSKVYQEYARLEGSINKKLKPHPTEADLEDIRRTVKP